MFPERTVSDRSVLINSRHMCDPRITSALNLAREANPSPFLSLVANDDALETSSVTSPRGSKRFGNERSEGEKERERMADASQPAELSSWEICDKPYSHSFR